MNDSGKKSKLEKLFFGLKHGSEYLNYGRDIIKQRAVEYSNRSTSADLKILDIGVGLGTDLANIRQRLKDRK